MKTFAENTRKKSDQVKEGTKLANSLEADSAGEEIKPDFPLIEKDEIKQAEAKMRKAAKKRN